MAEMGTFMVPTLQALDMLAAHPERWSLAPDKVARLHSIAQAASESVRTADAAGVAIASGTDVVGPWQGRRGEEIVLKARVLGAHKAIISATRTNAMLFRLGDQIGTVEEGKCADLILVAGEPLNDPAVLADPLAIPVVVKSGIVVKDVEGRARPAKRKARGAA
jgi:imidazolonepropionase-like amidohydrolase